MLASEINIFLSKKNRGFQLLDF